MKIRMRVDATLVALIGASCMLAFVDSQRHDPVVCYTGVAHLDTASYEEIYLNNAIFIDHARYGRLYLRFNDDKQMNDAIRRNVKVTGTLKSVRLENGELLKELNVQEVEILPVTDDRNELDKGELKP